MRPTCWFYFWYFLAVLFINLPCYGDAEKAVTPAACYSERALAQALQGTACLRPGQIAVDPQSFAKASFKRSWISAPNIHCNVNGRSLAMEVPLWAVESQNTHTLPGVQETLEQRFKARYNTKVISMGKRNCWMELGGQFRSEQAEDLLKKFKSKKASQRQGQGQEQERTAGRHSAISFSGLNTIATMAYDRIDFWNISPEHSGASSPRSFNGVLSVDGCCIDSSCGAGHSSQTAIPRCDKSSAEYSGCTQTSRSEPLKANWQRSSQSLKPDREILEAAYIFAQCKSQAQGVLDEASARFRNVAIKAEDDPDNQDDDLEVDQEEQQLAQRVQELLQQSANLAIPAEIQEVQDSEEEGAPKSKRPRSFEPFGHGALATAPPDTAM
eukprot:s332_g44.t1